MPRSFFPLVLTFFLFFHHHYPHHDIIRIMMTSTILMTFMTMLKKIMLYGVGIGVVMTILLLLLMMRRRRRRRKRRRKRRRRMRSRRRMRMLCVRYVVTIISDRDCGGIRCCLGSPLHSILSSFAANPSEIGSDVDLLPSVIWPWVASAKHLAITFDSHFIFTFDGRLYRLPSKYTYICIV